MGWDTGQSVEAYPFVTPLPNPALTHARSGAVGNSFFIGEKRSSLEDVLPPRLL